MSGWKQAPVLRPVKRQCPHLGAVFAAAFALDQHDVGHEYVCVCGQVFVVVSNGPNGPKKLVERAKR